MDNEISTAEASELRSRAISSDESSTFAANSAVNGDIDINLLDRYVTTGMGEVQMFEFMARTRLTSSTAFINRLLCMDIDGNRRLSHSEWLEGAVAEPHVLRCFMAKAKTSHDRKTTSTGPQHKRSRSSDLRQNVCIAELKVNNPPRIEAAATAATTEAPPARGISLLSPSAASISPPTNTVTRDETNIEEPVGGEHATGLCQSTCRKCTIC